MASLGLRGFLLGLAIAAAPGPIFFLCVRRTVAGGFARGLVSGLGVATADGFYAALAAFGVTAMSAILLAERRWLVLAGGAALVGIGMRTLILRPAPAEPAATPVGAAALGRDYLSTLGLTIANPATILSFAAAFAALGAFSAPGQGGLAGASLIVLGVAAGSVSWWIVVAGGAAQFRRRARPTLIRSVSIVSGLALTALGVAAAAAGIRG